MVVVEVEPRERSGGRAARGRVELLNVAIVVESEQDTTRWTCEPGRSGALKRASW